MASGSDKAAENFPFQDVTNILQERGPQPPNPVANLLRLQPTIIIRTPFSTFVEKAERIPPHVILWVQTVIQKHHPQILAPHIEQGRICTGLSIREIPFSSTSLSTPSPYIVGVACFEKGFTHVFRLRVEPGDYTLDGKPLYHFNFGPIAKWKSSAMWLHAKEEQRSARPDREEWYLVNRDDWSNEDGPGYNLSDFEE